MQYCVYYTAGIIYDRGIGDVTSEARGLPLFQLDEEVSIEILTDRD